MYFPSTCCIFAMRSNFYAWISTHAWNVNLDSDLCVLCVTHSSAHYLGYRERMKRSRMGICPNITMIMNHLQSTTLHQYNSSRSSIRDAEFPLQWSVPNLIYNPYSFLTPIANETSCSPFSLSLHGSSIPESQTSPPSSPQDPVDRIPSCPGAISYHHCPEQLRPHGRHHVS